MPLNFAATALFHFTLADGLKLISNKNKMPSEVLFRRLFCINNNGPYQTGRYETLLNYDSSCEQFTKKAVVSQS